MLVFIIGQGLVFILDESYFKVTHLNMKALPCRLDLCLVLGKHWLLVP